MKWQKAEDHCIMKCFIICTLQQYYYNYQIEEEDKVSTWEDEKSILNFGWVTQRVETTTEDLGIDRIILLK